MSPCMDSFDEVKYKELMDGHECCEVLFSELDPTKRLDAEYYAKEYIYEMEQLQKRRHFALKERYKVTDGEHGSVEYLDNGVRYLTAENIKKGFVDLTKVRYVSEAVDKRNARASVRAEDILISIKGTLGSVAVATNDLLPCNMNRDVAVIKPLSPDLKANHFLALFLMGKYGALQSRRGGSGGVQQMITLGRLGEFIIPAFGEELYEAVRSAYELFLDLTARSKRIFAETEAYLLEQLGINMVAFENRNATIKTLGNTFQITGRLDAEYYQDGIDKLIEALQTTATIGSACNIYDRTYVPDRNTKYQYIELSNIGKNGEIEDVETITGADLPSRARRVVRAGQIIASSIEGSLESCALVTPEYDHAFCSTGFYVIDSCQYNSETLLVLLKSMPIQRLLKRGCSGTILTNITKDEFSKIPLPKVSDSVQEAIKARITLAYESRSRSKKILEYARQSVEKAIEEGESLAVSWLTAKMNESDPA